MSRRGASEGSIYQRADGRWTAAAPAGYAARVRPQAPGVEHPTANVRRRKQIYGRTRAEVATRLRQLQQQLAAGLPVVDERTTVEQYLRHWLEVVKPRVRPATLARYEGIVRGQLIPHLGHHRLAQLQPGQVARALAAIQEGGLSPRTAAHVRAVLRTALSDAAKWDLVSRNVASLTDPPRVPRPSPKVLPVDDVQRVIAAVTGTDVENPAVVALFTGLREGEVLGLRWGDVDLESCRLTVGSSLQRLARVSKLVEPKSEHSRRTLRLPGPAVAALRSERQKQLEARVAAGSRWKPAIPDLVFTGPLGQPMIGSTITRRFQDALKRAGLERLRFHHLRHLFGSLTLASGVDLATVSHLLGHSSVQLTASTYVGQVPALRDDAADRLERLLSRSI